MNKTEFIRELTKKVNSINLSQVTNLPQVQYAIINSIAQIKTKDLKYIKKALNKLETGSSRERGILSQIKKVCNEEIWGRASIILNTISVLISSVALLIVAGFSIWNVSSSNKWQNDQLKELQKQTLILEEIKHTMIPTEE